MPLPTGEDGQGMFRRVALQQTDSTNRYLTDLCDGGGVEEFTTVSAEFQTAGKGQRGNSWEAEAGANLLFSTLFYPRFLAARRQFLLSQLVSLSIKEVLDAYTADISIKWPNDIYWQERKICGILIENDLQGATIGRCIVGVGLNVNQERFLSDAPNPVSLRQITGRLHDRDTLLTDVVVRMQCHYRRLRDDASGAYAAALADRYAAALFRREGFHRYVDADGSFKARLVGVEPDGRFCLEDRSGRLRRYLFKEVQYLLS